MTMLKTVAAVLGLVISLLTVSNMIWRIIGVPALAYEDSKHYLPSEKGLVSVVVSNGGLAAGGEVKIGINVSGEIENVSLMSALPSGAPVPIVGEYPSIKIEGSRGAVSIPFVPKGMKYYADFIVKLGGTMLTYELSVFSRDEAVPKYSETTSVLWWSMGVGLLAGILGTVSILLLWPGVRALFSKPGKEKV